LRGRAAYSSRAVPADDAELRTPDDGCGVTLVGVELVHVPRIGYRAENAPTIPERCSHCSEALQESLGALRAHRILAVTPRVF
jgi:hypothetical protein